MMSNELPDLTRLRRATRFALVGFGGAAGQHVCAVARRLGIRRVLLHPLAGLLSAWGIGLAERGWDGQQDAGRVPLERHGRAPSSVEELLRALLAVGREALEAEGVRVFDFDRFLDLRYAGAETALTLREPVDGRWDDAFESAHHARFGYTRRRAIEVVTARVRAREFPRTRCPPPSRAAGRSRAESPVWGSKHC